MTPEQSRRRARQEARELMANRPVAQHLRGTGELPDNADREPARSLRGGAPERGEWNTAPAAHGRDAGTGRDVVLSGQPAPLHATNMVDQVYEGVAQEGTLSGHLRRLIAARRQRTAQAR